MTMPVTVMMSRKGPRYALLIIEISATCEHEKPGKCLRYIEVLVQPRERFEPSGNHIDRGKSAGRVAVSGGEQRETSVAVHGAVVLFTHQRLQDDVGFSHLTTHRVHRGPPSPPASLLRLQLDVEQRLEADPAYPEIGIVRANHRHSAPARVSGRGFTTEACQTGRPRTRQ